MVALKIFSFAALAVSALAGPIDTTEKSAPFKIGITFGSETLYLTQTSKASPNIADGIECTITTNNKSNGRIACGPEGKAFTYSEFHTVEPLKPVKSDSKNTAWSIKADNTLYWGAMPSYSKSVSFSRSKGQSRHSIYGEVCSSYNHHEVFPGLGDFWEPGVAKAYFV